MKKIEEIFPLTIVNMRYGQRLVIFNAYSICDFIASVQEDEEVHYILEEWLEEHVLPFCNYGIGETIEEAFEDYKKRLK